MEAPEPDRSRRWERIALAVVGGVLAVGLWEAYSVLLFGVHHVR